MIKFRDQLKNRETLNKLKSRWKRVMKKLKFYDYEKSIILKSSRISTRIDKWEMKIENAQLFVFELWMFDSEWNVLWVRFWDENWKNADEKNEKNEKNKNMNDYSSADECSKNLS